MIEVSRVEVNGFANALYGMRLPKNSNNRSDTSCLVFSARDIFEKSIGEIETGDIVLETYIGEKDKELAEKLVLAGTDHGKWLRQVSVSMVIKAPMTFWWDFDTYKVATTKNSSSRMHTITNRTLNKNDFSWEDENGELILTKFREETLDHLNKYIEEFNSPDTESERKQYLFRLIIQDLPDSYNFTALWTGSAQTCRNYYFARRNHKQKELRDLATIMSKLKDVGSFITLQ